MPLLEVKDLCVSFNHYTSAFIQETIEVLHGVELTLEKGEIVAVVGSSGSGKSLLAHALMGILPGNARASGTIRYKGEPLTEKKLGQLRGTELALIPQSVNYLDPLMRVGTQVQNAPNNGRSMEQVHRTLQRLGLSSAVSERYPFELSGGMARRVLLSTAIVSGAQLIVADEPTPGLHAQVVTETLQQFRELASHGCSILLITHDIEAALLVADRIAVFYAGTIVETAPTEDFAGHGERLRHPYSRALWRALPQNDFMPIPGAQPQPGSLPSGCTFAPRCKLATSECNTAQPETREVRGGMVRCVHAS